MILKLARSAQADTGSKRLCLAGGVGLNSKANGRLLNETPFEEIYIQPAAGNSGGALADPRREEMKEIVNTPAQALNTFYNSGMDTLVIVVRKDT